MAASKTIEVIPQSFSYVFSPYREPIAARDLRVRTL